MKREEEPWDAWCIALSPSIELHVAAYGKGGVEPISWDDYERRFLKEMERQRYWIDSFAGRVRAGETLTLLSSSACVDEARCHRTLLARRIEAGAFPKAPPEDTGTTDRSASPGLPIPRNISHSEVYGRE